MGSSPLADQSSIVSKLNIKTFVNFYSEAKAQGCLYSNESSFTRLWICLLFFSCVNAQINGLELYLLAFHRLLFCVLLVFGIVSQVTMNHMFSLTSGLYHYK